MISFCVLPAVLHELQSFCPWVFFLPLDLLPPVRWAILTGNTEWGRDQMGSGKMLPPRKSFQKLISCIEFCLHQIFVSLSKFRHLWWYKRRWVTLSVILKEWCYINNSIWIKVDEFHACFSSTRSGLLIMQLLILYYSVACENNLLCYSIYVKGMLLTSLALFSICSLKGGSTANMIFKCFLPLAAISVVSFTFRWNISHWSQMGSQHMLPGEDVQPCCISSGRWPHTAEELSEWTSVNVESCFS